MKISFAAILLVILCDLSSSQWRQTNGPNTYGGVIRPVVLSGNNLYAVIPAHGLYLSSNSGNSWTKISSNLTATVYCVAVDGNKIYIGTNLGLYTSPTQNISWTLAQNIGLNDTDFLSITVKGNKIYAGTIDGVYLSTNSGNSWSHILAITTGPVSSIVIDSINSNTNYLYAGSLQDIYISQDNGSTWFSELDPRTIYGIACNGSYIYAAVGSYGFYYSTDYGTTWIAGQVNGLFYALESEGNKVYLGGASGLYESSDNSGLWTNILPNTDISSICSSNNFIAAGTDGFGVNITSDGGQSWAVSNNGLTAYPNKSILFAGNRLISGTSGAGIFISDDNGRNWINTFNTVNLIIYQLSGSGSSYYAIAPHYLYSSTDYGSSWTLAANILIGGCIAGKDNFILFGGIWGGDNNLSIKRNPEKDKPMGGIYLSTDNGSSWTKTYDCTTVNSINFAGSNIFASTACAVLISSSNGWSWTNISGGLPDTYINQFYFFHNKIYIAMSTYGVYYTSDNGTTWIPANTGLTDLHTKCFASNNENLFVCTNNGIYRTIDDGAHWTSYNLNLPDSASVMSLAMNGNNLFAGTQSDKVWMTTISEFTGIKQNNNSIPKDYALYQNYPNPFNPSTKIYYDLPVESNVKLVVYDITGREVKTIVNTKQNAGKYQVDFNADNFASGVYFYKLQTGSFTETKKMLMIK